MRVMERDEENDEGEGRGGMRRRMMVRVMESK